MVISEFIKTAKKLSLYNKPDKPAKKNIVAIR